MKNAGAKALIELSLLIVVGGVLAVLIGQMFLDDIDAATPNLSPDQKLEQIKERNARSHQQSLNLFANIRDSNYQMTPSEMHYWEEKYEMCYSLYLKFRKVEEPACGDYFNH
jgi:hypothetical protein